MFKKGLIYSIAVVLLVGFGCKNGGQNAFDYNIELSKQNNRVVDAVNLYYYHLQNDELENADTARQYMLLVCDSVIADMKALGGYEKDTALINALISYVEMQKGLAQVEFKELVDAYNTLDQINSTTSEPDIDSVANAYLKIDMISNTIDEKDSIYYSKAAAIQKKFALKHGFRIEESETDSIPAN